MGQREAAGPRRLHDAAWPDMLADLQSAYAELSQAQLTLQRQLAEIEEARDLFQQVIASMSEGLFLLDHVGRISRVNPAAAAMLGCTEESLADRTLREVCGTADIPTTPWQVLQRSASGTLTHLEVEFQRPAGGTIPVSVSVGLIRDKRGKILGTLVVARDVTAQRRLEEQLRQAQRLESVGRLAGGMAHEANNQMTVILGAAEFVLRDRTLSPSARNDVEQIRNAAQRTASITSQLLAFSRQQILRPEILDLNELVTGLDPVLRRTLGEECAVRLDLDPSLGRVRADRGQIEQVLLNLTLNARDAMPHGGMLTLRTGNVVLDDGAADRYPGVAIPRGRYAHLMVRDTGHGMSAEVMARIFEPFFTTKEVGKGTGLGLATVYGIVKQSGGHVWAESEPGIGTAFHMYLPLVAAPPRRVAAEGDAPVARGGETVLLVEDEPGVRQMTARMLRDMGYEVLEAANGLEAIETAVRLGPRIGVVLTDIVMPGLNGRELAERLARLQHVPPILFMSGYTSDEIGQRNLLDQGQPFLQKPLSRDTLGQRVREAIDAPGASRRRK